MTLWMRGRGDQEKFTSLSPASATNSSGAPDGAKSKKTHIFRLVYSKSNLQAMNRHKMKSIKYMHDRVTDGTKRKLVVREN